MLLHDHHITTTIQIFFLFCFVFNLNDFTVVFLPMIFATATLLLLLWFYRARCTFCFLASNVSEWACTVVRKLYLLVRKYTYTIHSLFIQFILIHVIWAINSIFIQILPACLFVAIADYELKHRWEFVHRMRFNKFEAFMSNSHINKYGGEPISNKWSESEVEN